MIEKCKIIVCQRVHTYVSKLIVIFANINVTLIAQGLKHNALKYEYDSVSF